MIWKLYLNQFVFQVTERHARVNKSMTAQLEEEVDLFEGDIVTISEKVDKNFFRGTSCGRTGIFPCAFVTLIDGSQAAAAPDPPKSAQSLNNHKPMSAVQTMPYANPSRLKIYFFNCVPIIS